MLAKMLRLTILLGAFGLTSSLHVLREVELHSPPPPELQKNSADSASAAVFADADADGDADAENGNRTAVDDEARTMRHHVESVDDQEAKQDWPFFPPPGGIQPPPAYGFQSPLPTAFPVSANQLGWSSPWNPYAAPNPPPVEAPGDVGPGTNAWHLWPGKAAPPVQAVLQVSEAVKRFVNPSTQQANMTNLVSSLGAFRDHLMPKLDPFEVGYMQETLGERHNNKSGAEGGRWQPRKPENIKGQCTGDYQYPYEVHVLAWRRPNSTGTLLKQLNSVNYLTDAQVPIYIHADGEFADRVKVTAETLNWSHGPKILDFHEGPPRGLRMAWIDTLTKAAKKALPNTLMLVFEDDMRVSPYYMYWLSLMLKRYAGRQNCRDHNLMGLSLSPVRYQEMREPMGEVKPKFDSAAYLSTLPSSWGAAYFADRWLEFHEFASVRMQPKYFNYETEAAPSNAMLRNNETGENEVHKTLRFNLSSPALEIPEARSNWWPKSWKRFMVDFMYGRGLWMLYPNFVSAFGRPIWSHYGLAASMAFCGEHVSLLRENVKGSERGEHQLRPLQLTSQEQKEMAVECDRKSAMPSMKEVGRNERMPRLLQVEDAPDFNKLILPDYAELPTLDLFFEATTREEAALRSSSFLAGVGSHPQFEALAKAWARLEQNETHAARQHQALAKAWARL